MKEYDEIEVREGDGLVEAMEEAIREGGEGGVQVRLFEILKLATGKGKKIKWRGAKQEGKTSYKGRGKPPVRLSALYRGGKKENGVATLASEVLAETRTQAAATNGMKESFPQVARALMGALRPFPEQADARTQWTEAGEREYETYLAEQRKRIMGVPWKHVGCNTASHSSHTIRGSNLYPQRR